jgi:hypothetical protein
MNKILLLAMLLSLTGCGDNNQSDTTQSNSQVNTLQKPEALPAVAKYSLAASPRTMGAVAPLAGWSITKSTVMGASTLIDAVKDSKISAALISPNAKQVVEVLRGGAAGIALSVAVDQLLGAVDWVIDPANNQITYIEIKESTDPNIEIFYRPPGAGYVCYSVSNCKSVLIPVAKFHGWDVISCSLGVGGNIFCPLEKRNDKGVIIDTTVEEIFRVAKPDYKPKTLPLETVAERIISNADSGSLDAQVATNIAAQNILNDVVQAEPVVQELENNSRNNCPSGITNGKGDCWVCSRESYTPIRARVIYAKDVVGGLGDCKSSMNSSQLLTRRDAYSELGNARDAENSCWSPPDSNHLQEALQAKKIAAECNTYLGALGQ